jgi:hypothetical protein
MAKYVTDELMDYYLNKISACSSLIAVCAGSPTTWQNCTQWGATGGCMIALMGITSGCFSVGVGSPNGRTLTVTAKTGASIVYSGSALAVALLNASSSGVAYITTATQQYLVSGGTVDIPSWTINLASPT